MFCITNIRSQLVIIGLKSLDFFYIFLLSILFLGSNIVNCKQNIVNKLLDHEVGDSQRYSHYFTIVVMHPKIRGEHALTIPLSTQPRLHPYHFSIAEVYFFNS